MKRLFFLLFFLGTFFLSKAQYFQTGQDPASIQWRQINTENFQLIYPDYYETQAQKLAHVLEKVYDYGSYSLNYKPKKISVILHTQTVKSNGLVAIAPQRAEFYTTPHQGIYPQEWLEQLAIHEFRHVVQVGKINSEVPGLVKAIFGEQGTALIFGAYLPWWFTEGDAVVTETALSNYGRGRFPSFLVEHKAQVVEKGIYSYDKAYNGSFKDFVPNHYRLGYYLVGNARFKYGSELWESVVTNVGKRPLSLNPFNSALKKNIGLNKVDLYFSVFDSLKNVWIEKDNAFVSSSYNKISPSNKWYSNYNHNYWYNDSTVISYKSSLNEISSFVKIDKKGKEEKIFYPGSIFNESVNYHDNFIIWSEQIPDLRWSHSGKSLIRIFDFHTRSITELKPEFKSFSPSISPDNKSVALVETDFSSNNYISVYSISDGKLLTRIQTENNNYFFSPEWLNQKEIAVVILTENGKRLAKIDLETGETEILIKEDLGELKHLKLAGNQLFFISSYSGKNALYSYNLTGGDIHFVYEPRFGVESPSVSQNNDEILLSDYTANGFRIIQIPNIPENLVDLNSVEKGKYPLADALAKQEPGIPDLSSAESLNYSSEKYSKPTHLLNFHSWAPVFIDVNAYTVIPGVSLMSQNKLGTAETTLGYKWDVTEKTGKFYANYTYKGWYPVLSLELSTGKSAAEYYLIQPFLDQNTNTVEQDTTLERFTWNETNAGVDIKIPLNLTKGVFYRLIQPEIQYNFTYYEHDSSTLENYFSGNFQTLLYRLYFHQLLKQSSQDVYPDFGLVIDGVYKHSPFGSTDLGSLATAQSIIYLPGILKNHGIRIYSGIQKKKINDSFNFSDAIRYPRGRGKINTTEMYSLGIDYKLPLFYPDWSLGGLAYLKRVNASLFGDFARLNGNVYQEGIIVNTFSKDISSIGIELTGDINFLRFYAPVNIGVRTSYLPELKNVHVDFLFSIDLTSL